MKKLIYFGLVLSILLLAAGCAAREPEPSPTPSETVEPSPSPSVEPTPEPTETPPLYTKDMVFDADGEPILGEYGHIINFEAAAWIMDELTTEEIMKISPHSDGFLAEKVSITLARRLVNDFDNTLSVIASVDLSTFYGGRERFDMVCFGIGYEIWLDLECDVISEDDAAVIFAEHDLTEMERAVLNKIIEGYNQAVIDDEMRESMNS